MPFAIEVENATKVYRSFKGVKTAVDDVSLRLKEGQTLGLVGANGAGKSTLIKSILGVIKLQSGQVSLFGRSALDPRSREDVAFVAESSVLHDTATPLDIMRLSRDVSRRSSDEQHLKYWLGKFGVDHVADKPLRGMSKGMAQRVALANALSLEPRLLILDEPLSGLDPMGRIAVVDILADYKANGGTLFFTSHVLHDVERLADHYCIIHNGKIVADKSRDQITMSSSLNVVVKFLNGDQTQYKVSRDILWDKLESVRKQGGVILSVTPELDLEAYFYHAIS